MKGKRMEFGTYRIERVIDDNGGVIWVEGNADHAFRLSGTVALALPYRWMKTTNTEQPSPWGTGLFRYPSTRVRATVCPSTS